MFRFDNLIGILIGFNNVMSVSVQNLHFKI